MRARASERGKREGVKSVVGGKEGRSVSGFCRRDIGFEIRRWLQSFEGSVLVLVLTVGLRSWVFFSSATPQSCVSDLPCCRQGSWLFSVRARVRFSSRGSCLAPPEKLIAHCNPPSAAGMAENVPPAEKASLKRKAEELMVVVKEEIQETKRRTTNVACVHEVAIPPGFEASLSEQIHGTIHNPVYTGSRAKTYPFKLDAFQETSVACLERKESVLVSAHTSAGKTAVAEYAIAMAFRDKQRVIYTSPLKALSNQKYRELSQEFQDVGLMTGDVTIAPNATCIVMTTEILRGMLYRGSEVLREVAWVVFDEIHYMRDRERGVVWEESIIFLPNEVKMVFLSATMSNAKEFAEWICHLHHEPCHVVYTDYRPTPLQHYAFPMGGSGLYLIVDEKGQFREDHFNKLTDTFPKEGRAEDGMSPPGGGRGRGRGGRGGRGGGRGGRGAVQGPPDIYKIVKVLILEPQTWLLCNLQTEHGALQNDL